MKKIKIEKYIQDTLDESFTVPVAFIRILTSLLPHSALVALHDNGFDLDNIIMASKQDKPYQAEASIEEKGVMKRIVITLV